MPKSLLDIHLKKNTWSGLSLEYLEQHNIAIDLNIESELQVFCHNDEVVFGFESDTKPASNFRGGHREKNLGGFSIQPTTSEIWIFCGSDFSANLAQ